MKELVKTCDELGSICKIKTTQELIIIRWLFAYNQENTINTIREHAFCHNKPTPQAVHQTLRRMTEKGILIKIKADEYFKPNKYILSTHITDFMNQNYEICHSLNHAAQTLFDNGYDGSLSINTLLATLVIANKSQSIKDFAKTTGRDYHTAKNYIGRLWRLNICKPSNYTSIIEPFEDIRELLLDAVVS